MMPKRSVLVAMSGGVDSSVAAALLKNEGWQVTGGFMKNWVEPIGSQDSCTWSKDFKDMRSVCQQLRIKALLFDFAKEYKDRVFKHFLNEYRSGNTPNPDIACNREIKFGLFLEKAKKLGFDYIATGHYALIKSLRKRNTKRFDYQLLKGKDKDKDQSYFLYQLTQEQLSRTLFPVGQYPKPAVRKLAKKFRLGTHDRPDSQGICNIGEVNLHRFLSKYISMTPGDIILESGKPIGRHNGLAAYTIGQRKGISIGGGTPYFVVKKNIKKNQLIVSDRNSKLLYNNALTFIDLHWISGKAPKFPLKAKVKIRYRQEDQSATIIKKSKNKFDVKFSKPQRAISPGQSCVIYQGNIVLGGGIIIK